MKNHKSILSIVLIAVCLQGCVATSYISSIGAREQFGVLEKNTDSGKVKIYESKMLYKGEECVASFPYISLCRENKSKYINEYPYTINSPHLISENIINIQMENNKTLKFEEYGLSIYRNDIAIIRRYREAYGYPIQIFQAVAIPLDLVIVTGGFIGLLIEDRLLPKKQKHD